ncbi:hypothetical protein MLD38_024839 [Melastoma candidum]|uniref:Uncharacterized protein n=1 Tax=Melastoma candidum TaxID=119954 RepID=A0ACB9NTL4_9MYRT|nr:hypothetical protein MLD38_024839 [Melastoma candidum]
MKGSFRLSTEKFCEAGRKGFSVLSWKLFLAVLALLFSVFGITTGVVSGAFIGLRTRNGILHGAAAGAIFSIVLSSWLLRACVVLWDCEDSFSLQILSQMDSMAIMAAKLAHYWGTQTKEHPATGRQNRDQLPGIGSTDEPQVYDCSICQQEVEVTQVRRRLPQCQHTFHADCVDTWFCYQRSCPLCRHRA